MKWLFCPIPQGKHWDGTTIHTDSLGGSEASVAYLARELARKGEEVIVMGHLAPNVQEPKTIDDVVYMPQSHLQQLIRQAWDVVVSVRWPDILNNLNWNTHIPIIWLHDMPGGPVTEKARHAVVLSKYQQQHWRLSDSNSIIIGNGIDPSLYTATGISRDGNKLLWTSNPDRGLALGAEIFQKARKAWPDLELHIFGRASVYGWAADAEEPFLPRPQHMENVFLHEPLKKTALAAELQSAWALFYPTYWPETFCIATLEAQAAGAPSIVPPFGALAETVKGGVVSYDFMNSISQLRNVVKYKKCQEAGYEYAESATWSKRADTWIELVHSTLKEAEGGATVDTPAIADVTSVEAN